MKKKQIIVTDVHKDLSKKDLAFDLRLEAKGQAAMNLSWMEKFPNITTLKINEKKFDKQYLKTAKILALFVPNLNGVDLTQNHHIKFLDVKHLDSDHVSFAGAEVIFVQKFCGDLNSINIFSKIKSLTISSSACERNQVSLEAASLKSCALSSVKGLKNLKILSTKSLFVENSPSLETLDIESLPVDVNIIRCPLLKIENSFQMSELLSLHLERIGLYPSMEKILEAKSIKFLSLRNCSNPKSFDALDKLKSLLYCQINSKNFVDDNSQRRLQFSKSAREGYSNPDLKAISELHRHLSML